MTSKMIILFLPCEDDKEASKITKALLDKKLVACVKRIPVESAFLWKGKTEQDHEVLLMLESVEERFEDIESRLKGSFGN